MAGRLLLLSAQEHWKRCLQQPSPNLKETGTELYLHYIKHHVTCEESLGSEKIVDHLRVGSTLGEIYLQQIFPGPRELNQWYVLMSHVAHIKGNDHMTAYATAHQAGILGRNCHFWHFSCICYNTRTIHKQRWEHLIQAWLSMIPSLIHPFTDSAIHSSIHSFIPSFIPPHNQSTLFQSTTYCSIPRTIIQSVDSSIHSFIYSFISSFIHSLLNSCQIPSTILNENEYWKKRAQAQLQIW